MRIAVTILLVVNILFAATVQKIDSHALSKISFLVSHSWHHLHEDGLSVWQLISHYVEEWDAESHKPLEEKQDVPYRSLVNFDFSVDGMTFHYSANPVFLDTDDLKYPFHPFLLPSDYSGSIFHPPQYA